MFEKLKLTFAFNRAVDAHDKSKKAPTQLRPHIDQITGPLKPDPNLPGKTFYRLWYENGMNFAMDEEAIASVVHSYTALVSRETGDSSLIEKSYFDEPSEAPARAKGSK